MQDFVVKNASFEDTRWCSLYFESLLLNIIWQALPTMEVARNVSL